MEGNIVGEPIEGFVARQIDIRQRNQFGGYDSTSRTPNQIQYLNNRNAWVKLASSVDILEKLGLEKLQNIKIEDKEGYLGTKLAEKAILFNSLSSFDPSTKSYSNPRAGISNSTSLWNNNFAYGIGGTDFGIQPPPGIISVNVDSLNRGSIRKANITLKAHNRFQFDIIEILYLRLGFTMMLEWGWDKFLNRKGKIQQIGNTIIEEKWFTSNGISQLGMLEHIQNMRNAYDGNYDGFFGKVSNFTWNFNTDGSYDISIDLITLGDVIESIKVNTSVKNKFYSDQGIIEEIKFVKGEELYNTNIAKIATLNTVGYFLYSKVKELSTKSTLNNSNYIIFNPQNNSSNIQPQYYIRLGEFLKQLETLIMPKVRNNGKTLTSQISFKTDKCRISYYPNQIPIDPRVCIFKFALNSYGDITGINPPTYFNTLPLSPYIDSSENHSYGNLMNLYINFQYIAGLIASNGGPDQELFLYKFLQDLCNGINNSLGDVNKIEPIITDDIKITLIDQTYTRPNSQNSISLEVYGYNPKQKTSNFVKDVKFISKITPQLASMVSIGATAAGSSTSEIDGTAFSKWSDGLQDRFSQEILESDGLPKLLEEQTNEANAKIQETYKKKFLSFENADRSLEGIIDEIVDSSLSAVTGFQASVNTLFGGGDSFSGNNKDLVNRANLYRYIDNDINEKRIVKDSKLNTPPNGTAMYFNDYYQAILDTQESDRLNQIIDSKDISKLINENYNIYLLNAFSGQSNIIKVRTQDTELRVSEREGVVRGERNLDSSTVSFLSINQQRYQEFDDTFISQGKSAYKTYINNLNNSRYKETQTPSSEIGFIPLSFDVILDGISGIKIYNKLNINNEFLPSNYPNSLNFIITKVNHSITNNNWETSLSTISIPKTEPYKFNTSSTPTPQVVEYTPIAEALTPIQEFRGQLLPLKNIIGAYESNGRYDIANIGGSAIVSQTKVLNLPLSELNKFQSLPTGNPNRVFAAGKYQVIPDTLNRIQQGLKLTPNDKFSIENQEKIADYLLLSIRKSQIGNYLAGNNGGNIQDLENAIQGLGQEFASMPVIYSQTKQKVGDVTAGTGQVAYYGGKGANPTIAKIGIKEIVRILIQTRINYSNKPPVFIPIYYTS